jgi:hypothetical protein
MKRLTKSLWSITPLLILLTFSLSSYARDKGFEFKKRAVYDIKTTNKKGKVENSTMIIYFDDNKGGFAMEVEDKGSQTFFIYNADKKNFTTLVIDKKGSKSGTVFSEKAFYNAMNMANAFAKTTGKEGDMEFRKTGQTRTIQGLSADHYEWTNRNEEGEYWVAEDQEMGLKELMKLMSRAMPDLKNNLDQMPTGLMMASKSTNKKDGTQSESIITAYERGNFEISTEGFEIIDLGSLFGN